ncbi:MAG: DUF5723 family protein [Carboxylicivirga sp.]|jgi:hypothetical protein|nr:DUF5723 family protein [Carboxylicivirga sp.]
MKRSLLHIALFLMTFNQVISQEYGGVHTSPYLPFIGLTNQPAELVRHDATWNINLISAKAGLLKNISFVSGDFWDLIGRAGLGDLKFFLASDESLLYVKGRVIIPSITYKLNDRHSLGVTMSVRADGVYNSSNDEFLKIFKGIENPEFFEDIKGEYFRSLVNTWMEYGFAWSTTLSKTDNNWLTGGVVVKVLKGFGAGYLEMDDIDVMFDKEHISHFDMRMSYGFNEGLNKTINGGDIIEQSGDFGIGLDLGLGYSYQPDHLIGVKGMPYRYKLGFVVSDIGRINNRKTENQASYNVQMDNVPYSRFQGIETLEALKDSIEKSIDYEEIKEGSFRTNLPLTFSANVDYCFRPHWFVNSTLVFRPKYYNSLVKLVSKNIWRSNLTVRYETRKWGAYLPISYSSALGWSTGISARYRNLYIGSTTILGNLFGQGDSQRQIYFGLSIPIK